ncbi:hypothetical protein IT570_08390 [Candidatus Sumerlaeota bacterium]|nr:hypothetical protein [Candidatus Sumerlaeota bacterium]
MIFGAESLCRTRGILCVLCLLFSALFATPASAVVISVPILPEPVDIETTPTIHIIAHGPRDRGTYRLTVEFMNDDPSCTLTIAHGDPANYWATYDKDPAAFPLRALTPISWNVGERVYQIEKQVPVPSFQVVPRTGVVADLDFPLPEKVPETFMLHTNKIDIGCSATLEVNKELRLIGRDVLRSLQKDTE